MEMIYSKRYLDEKDYIQIARNYYAPNIEWIGLSQVEQHIELCTCIAKRHVNLLFTAQSACAVMDIARINPLGLRPHCISAIRRSTDIIRWHYGHPDKNAQLVQELLVAGPIRAICDLVGLDTPESLLVSINHCLHCGLFTKEQFAKELQLRAGMNGTKSLERLMSFATEKCESPLETIAWIALYKAGFVMPKQQVSIYEKYKFIARVDMYWELNRRKVILELDGRMKYTNEKDLFEEKKREDKLREMGYEVVRSIWDDVLNGRLERKLIEAGIPFRRYFGKLFTLKL